MSEKKHTVERLNYRPALRVANRLAWGARKARLSLTRIEPDSILSEARRKTGLSDWGDPTFLHGMRRLVDEANRLPLTDLARVVIRGAMLKVVTNRLYIEDYIHQHPEVEDIPVEKPVFILGFPRTGTTLLQNLLALDPGLRPLLFWELMTPVPLRADLVADRRERLWRARGLLYAAYFVAPEQDEIHHVELESPEECWPLFYNSFSAFNFDLQSGMEQFGDWLLQRDMTHPYREYRRQLQILAHRHPKQRFVLKCPEHLWFLDALTDVFPDASIIWTHRDPVACVGSYCSLISLNRRMLYGKIDLLGIGAHITDRFRLGVERAMAVRDRVGADRFFDVDFAGLVGNTPRIVRDIKQAFDIRNGRAEEGKIDRWLNQDRADARGAHKYSPERYGLDPDAIRAEFAPYIDRFKVTIKRR